ncbi:PD40 domain-containing protein [Cohnella terricola]|uniref:TolB protein n=1 Tax=Cohnella terricola TaxID=1289167 RepID=A0A559JFY8_9BACL|nr:PD40 domain-containing protein [Cohnella terricola]TVX98780.1 hypothetical protein FPZ45_15925 [Cohnella terricola]
MRSHIRAAAIMLSSLLLLAGCKQQWNSNREELQVEGKTITLLNNPEKTSYEKEEMNAIIRLNDVRGMDWLSDDRILVDRENREMKPAHADGGVWYPHNIYIHALSTGTDVPLLPSGENQGFAQASPDKNKIYYKTFSLQSNTGKGHLMDLSSGMTTTFTDEDEITLDNGSWIDNDSILYSTIKGTIHELRTDDGKPRQLYDARTMFPSNLAIFDGSIYYTTLKGSLFAVSSDLKEQSLLLDNAVWMTPSPDKQRLAIVRRIKSGEAELLITDLEGKVLYTVAQDSQIFGIAWSPDGTKLAYAGITSNGTARGVYVADTSTGLSATLALDVKFIADPVRWNPSGDRLMVSSTLPDEQQSRNRFVTYLVRVR